MPLQLHFSKMHGLGNDFIIIDGVSQPFSIKDLPIAQLADRFTGIGFDQLLVLLPSVKADFACRIFNSDGSEAEQCGNGLRCVARLVHEKKLISTNHLSLETLAGIISVTITDYETITINLGIPELQNKTLILAPFSEKLSVLSLGNPHAILSVEAVQDYPVATLGSAIGAHPFFTQGTNVGFMEIVNRQHIRLRTFERGVGETLACGSNASAAAVAGIWNDLLDHKVRVDLTLGSLWVEWEGMQQPVMMTGPASYVFSGTMLV